MYDLPPDLPRLRILETWLVMTLERVRQQITIVQQVEAMEAARKAPAPPLPAPDWVLELNSVGQPATVHAGDCTPDGKGAHRRPLSREAARRAIAVEQVEPCPFCRPDALLGVLD